MKARILLLIPGIVFIAALGAGWFEGS